MVHFVVLVTFVFSPPSGFWRLRATCVAACLVFNVREDVHRNFNWYSASKSLLFCYVTKKSCRRLCHTDKFSCSHTYTPSHILILFGDWLIDIVPCLFDNYVKLISFHALIFLLLLSDWLIFCLAKTHLSYLLLSRVWSQVGGGNVVTSWIEAKIIQDFNNIWKPAG